MSSPRVLDVLPRLSIRARNALRSGGIETVADLAQWNERSLHFLMNVGPMTALEIVTAARSAGLALAPEGAPYPWRIDPRRWGPASTKRTYGKTRDESRAMTVLPIAGAIANGTPLESAGARTTVEVPVDQVETDEIIYRIASTSPELDLRQDDLLVVEPRDNHAATAELVVAALGELLFIGRWWGKHGRRVVLDATLNPLIENGSLRVLGAVTVVMRSLE